MDNTTSCLRRTNMKLDLIWTHSTQQGLLYTSLNWEILENEPRVLEVHSGDATISLTVLQSPKFGETKLSQSDARETRFGAQKRLYLTLRGLEAQYG